MDALVQLDVAETFTKDADRCRDLWATVVALAWSDFTGKTVCASTELKEAIAFLKSKTGEWAESRAMVCALAGIDPDALTERAEQHTKRRKQ